MCFYQQQDHQNTSEINKRDQQGPIQSWRHSSRVPAFEMLVRCSDAVVEWKLCI